jgi:adenylylsulfate kinase-like enzyme
VNDDGQVGNLRRFEAEALLLNGTVGAGKTSIAGAIGDALAERGIAHAVLDIDWLRRSWPSPPDDPFNTGMALRNLTAVVRNYRDDGIRRLILAGVLESRAERRAYEAAVGGGLTVCRLQVDLDVVRDRLRRREPHNSDWFLARAEELDRIQRAADIDDVVVEASAGSLRAVAALVLTAVGW